jgi:histidyl-tRNA synthetase
LLDCKVQACEALKADAPRVRDSLSREDLETLERYRALLDEAAVPCEEQPRLVRGLDYYTGLVFEVEVMTDTGPVVLCGGGRYDGLVEKLGGPATLAAGYAIGLERLISCLPEPPPPQLDLFVLVPDVAAQGPAVKLMRRARSHGLSADLDPRAGSFKSQMKRANKLGSAYVAILGERELQQGSVSLKDMQSGEQAEVKLDAVVDELVGRLGR